MIMKMDEGPKPITLKTLREKLNGLEKSGDAIEKQRKHFIEQSEAEPNRSDFYIGMAGERVEMLKSIIKEVKEIEADIAILSPDKDGNQIGG